MIDLSACNGELRVKTKSAMNVFEVGSAAEKWREKILHPKTRAQKLGMKPGTRVRLAGEFEADFLQELKGSKGAILWGASAGSPGITFLAVSAKGSLAAIAKHPKKMIAAPALWA